MGGAMGRAVAVLTFGLATSSSSRFVGAPQLPSVSASCAAIEFLYAGNASDLKEVFVFAKEKKDIDFSTQWGTGLPVFDVTHEPAIYIEGQESWDDILYNAGPDVQATRFRALMRNLPPGTEFQVKLSSGSAVSKDSSPSSASEREVSNDHAIVPASPINLEIHRTDPRSNVKKQDGSVCVDLHWSHPHMQLSSLPDDVYFRIHLQYDGEESRTYCSDEVGKRTRTCGVPLDSVTTDMPSSFATLCGLRPKRHVSFTVDAFNCDGKTVSRHVTAHTPPEAPHVTTQFVTNPASQGSTAGFFSKLVVDWMPQHDDLITGHAIYLSLKDLGSMKLLCWAPHDSKKDGHVELPIKHKNHTHSADAKLLEDYLHRFHVHQEQQVLVATRTVGNLESPMYAASLGDWLIMEESVKCLTKFGARTPSYVKQALQLAWTQAQSLALYD